MGPPLVALTRGAKGAILSAEGCVVEVPGRTTAVIDTIGARDTFMASLIADYPSVHGSPLSAENRWALGTRAAAAAAITVARAGADLPWAAEVDGRRIDPVSHGEDVHAVM